ncbi:MAG: general secretion pathway protein GspK, partial [Deltaproteobacteria bacterium]|nr:general secretion pathway protein GspK [Deltaproteobacteria bacterium]
MNKILNNENGVALVVTLAIVAILTTAALQMGKFTGDSVLITSVDKNRFEAEQLAISGIHLASLILINDAQKNSIDSVQEAWADPGKLSQAVNELGLDKETLS